MSICHAFRWDVECFPCLLRSITPIRDLDVELRLLNSLTVIEINEEMLVDFTSVAKSGLSVGCEIREC